MRIAALALMLAAVTLPARGEEQWIIPVYGKHVQGVGYTYDSFLSLGNAGSSPASVRVTDIIPLTSEPCAGCRPTTFELTIPPYETRTLSNFIVLDSEVLLLGAAVIASDRPLEVRAEIVGTGQADLRWQTVEIARGWLTGRSRIDRAFRGEGGSINLFLVNPNAFPIEVEYSTKYGGFGKSAVPPHSSVLRVLAPFFYCPKGCATTGQLGLGVDLELTCSSNYLAATSNPSRLLAPVVRIPYALK
ncbi:MAG: hypothetical protein ABIP63_00450 [Thermoanaerobaculia bacterium]